MDSATVSFFRSTALEFRWIQPNVFFAFTATFWGNVVDLATFFCNGFGSQMEPDTLFFPFYTTVIEVRWIR